MLSPEKHCEFLSTNVQHRTDVMMSWFKLFVQMYAAIVGGAVAVRLQWAKDINWKFIVAADVVAAVVAIASLLMVRDAYRAWQGQRHRLTVVAGTDESGNDVIPRPDLKATGTTYKTMLAVMIVSLVAFWLFNPLQW